MSDPSNTAVPAGDIPGPFTCTYTPNVPELLNRMGGTLVLSTYQAGKIIFLSPKNNEELVQLPRNAPRCMALGLSGDKLTLATRDAVWVLKNESTLAPTYPNQPGVYDALFVPRTTYHTSHQDLHGLEWGSRGLWAVNTLFSCLALVTEEASFEPVWKPSWISALAPEDRCHLNGMAAGPDGDPLFVTAFGETDEPRGWQAGLPGGGVVVNVPTGEIVAKDLPMPHSPRIYDGALYLLLSATGELVRLDLGTGKYDIVKQIDGFLRGMIRIGDHLFIAHSKLRQNASTFRDLAVASKATEAGVLILHLPTAALVGRITFRASVDEIFDLAFLPGIRRPGIVTPEMEVSRRAVVVPGTSWWAMENPAEEVETS